MKYGITQKQISIQLFLALHNYGMMGIVAEVLNLDYKPVSVMCKKGHHPQNVQRPIPNHSEDMPEGTLRAILKQAGIAPEEFLSL